MSCSNYLFLPKAPIGIKHSAGLIQSCCVQWKGPVWCVENTRRAKDPEGEKHRTHTEPPTAAEQEDRLPFHHFYSPVQLPELPWLCKYTCKWTGRPRVDPDGLHLNSLRTVTSKETFFAQNILFVLDKRCPFSNSTVARLSACFHLFCRWSHNQIIVEEDAPSSQNPTLSPLKPGYTAKCSLPLNSLDLLFVTLRLS